MCCTWMSQLQVGRGSLLGVPLFKPLLGWQKSPYRGTVLSCCMSVILFSFAAQTECRRHPQGAYTGKTLKVCKQAPEALQRSPPNLNPCLYRSTVVTYAYYNTCYDTCV